ncbi:M20/M25/M40 family metallo-hydrolase [Christiangramia sabulilitoris]|uniref:Vacuolar membrane protease n=1 Tax=Christiangramia sabulilitoris TaxID=2583991 RepID=A0A550I8Q2_9FLAO|nr:M20/M25/M40 family metallo-hydrolase [Christiangramia sabulilitoris]TRO67218.1 M20/M25/M40 family metallo-hydrolase [Christiangramia sabulilitoris]
MTNRFSGFIAFLLIIIAVWLNFNFDQPDFKVDDTLSLTEFSTSRAFKHVEEIAQKPHYVGSKEHSIVRNYIVDELQKMGLEVQTQEGYSLNKQGEISRPQNILSRIEGTGNGKAMVLMTHYDSAMHSSHGASDAGSGVATILEGIRAFLEKGSVHQNDIILLFTDAEEIGLNGAKLFIEDHPWAEDVELALNFEARGSSGNPFMLLETNGKNARLIEAFESAQTQFPVTNSLAYSIYKMLPNDTDLTVLREQADINGYNFAFIDNHFNYHTANDLPENLNKTTLAHQGSYLMPLLHYFSNEKITDLKSDRDLIYFSLPFGEFVSYPFNWINPMLILAFIIFLALVIYGIRRETLNIVGILKGFLPLILSIIFSGLVVWGFWKFCLFIYPEYSEMEQGFTYNGYWYIALAIFLSLAVCFIIYHLLRRSLRTASVFVAPLLLWLLICSLIAVYLPGASYFIIPVYFGLLQLFVMTRIEQPNRILMVILSCPAIFILLPFIWSLPVALGLKMLFVTGIFMSLLFSLFLPLFGYFRRLKLFAVLSFLIFNVLLFIAHFHSDFNPERPKPNSLVYLQDLDEGTANWYSYDNVIDDWTAEYFQEKDKSTSSTESIFNSKYKTGFTQKADAPLIKISQPGIIIEDKGRDSLNHRSYLMKIAPKRPINKIEIFEIKDVDFKSFKVNGLEADDIYLGENKFHMFKRRWKERLLTYTASNQDTLRIEFSFEQGDQPEFVLYEAAYDLIGNEQLKVKERPQGMIPRPFVLNDATILKKTIKID